MEDVRLPPMPRVEDRIKESRETWRLVERGIAEAELKVAEDPVGCALRYIEDLKDDYVLFRDFLRDHFGVERRDGEVQVVDATLLPKANDERFFYEAAAMTLSACEADIAAALDLFEAVPWGDFSQAICRFVLEELKHAVAESGNMCEGVTQHPELRKAGAIGLSGWVLAQRNPMQHRRVRAALRSWEGSQDERLLGELPGAVALAWHDRPLDEPLRPTDNRSKNFVSRVEMLLSQVGSEAAEKTKATDEPLEENLHPHDEDELDAFARREQRIQLMRELHQMMRAAKLSPNEWQVFTMVRMLQNRQISERTDRSADQIGVELSRARHKLRQHEGFPALVRAIQQMC